MSARECPSFLFIREERVPKQVLSTRSAPPPALGVRAPRSSSPPRCPPPQPLNAGGERKRRSRDWEGVRRDWEGVRRGCRFSVPPTRDAQPQAAQTPGRASQSRELGLPDPQSPSPGQGKPAGRPAGESYRPRPRSEDRRRVRGSAAGGPRLSARRRSLQPAAAAPAAPAASGHRSPRPAETGGRWPG